MSNYLHVQTEDEKNSEIFINESHIIKIVDTYKEKITEGRDVKIYLTNNTLIEGKIKQILTSEEIKIRLKRG